MSRLVVVTGASRGLGLALAKHFVAKDYRVLLVARQCPPAVAEWLEQEDSACFEACDLADLEQLHGFSRELIQRHGTPWALVNNAAMGKDGVLATQHESEIAQLLTVNLQAPILLTKYLLRAMLVRGEGRIVNVSSIIADTGFKGLSVYGATKAGLNGFTRSLAREVGSAGITVNAIAPGYMETEMTAGMSSENLDRIRRRSPLNRLARVEDVAAAAELLLSDAGRSITGTVLTVDAGSTA